MIDIESRSSLMDGSLVKDYVESSIKFSLHSIECYLALIKQKDLECIETKALMSIGRTLIDVANALRAIEDSGKHIILNNFNFVKNDEIGEEAMEEVKAFVEKRTEEITQNSRNLKRL